MATVALRYQDRQVLVTDLRPEADRRLLDFCREHTRTLIAPIGWVLRDERASARPAAQGSFLPPPFATYG